MERPTAAERKYRIVSAVVRTPDIGLIAKIEDILWPSEKQNLRTADRRYLDEHPNDPKLDHFITESDLPRRVKNLLVSFGQNSRCTYRQLLEFTNLQVGFKRGIGVDSHTHNLIREELAKYDMWLTGDPPIE